MLKYITFSGIALFVLSEIGVFQLGQMLKIKRETGVPVKTQLIIRIKSSQR